MGAWEPPKSPEEAAAWPPEIQAFLRSLMDCYERRLAQLQAEIDRLKKTPQNSSLPPSSQHPHSKPASSKPKSKRKRGGQPGHPKHERALIPAEQCQAVVPLIPKTCRRCGKGLTGIDPAPLRHQVWEVPPIVPQVTEYQQHRLHCACCGISTCGQLPAGVPSGQAGPRLIALTALLMGCFRQSKARVAMFLEQVLCQPCSPAWVVKLQNRATAALRPAYDELAELLPSQPQLSIDETPTKEATEKTTLWTVVAATFTVFAVRGTRGACELVHLLTTEFKGVVNCDRAKAYFWLGRLQWCWAHLKRDFQALADCSDNQVKRLGHDLLRQTKELFRHWSRCRDGTITRAELQKAMTPIRQEVEALLLRGQFSGNPRLTGMCRQLHNHRQRLWVFLDVEGVEPTNNASERALRHAVIWRKLSFGTQSNKGSRFVETILTVVETCRQQSRSVYDFIAEATAAHFANTNPPSLLTKV